MLRVELHAHTSDDPRDRIPHSATELIDRAASLGYGALAITLHDRQLDIRPLMPYAAERRVTLIPGIERSIEGRHVLLINFASGTEEVRSFEDAARLKREQHGLVIAPHPFFPAGSCLRSRMDRHADLFDAVEYNAMFAPGLNFNRRAVRWAARHGKPMVGNGDVHRLHQLGTTWSMVDAEPNPDAICAAIRAARVRVEARPLPWVTAVQTMTELLWDEVTGRRSPR
jgi:predicted metal-dependent phosphoesterase TrpH